MHRGSCYSLLIVNWQDHFMYGLKNRVWVDRVTAVFHNHLASASREPRKLSLQLMDPEFMKISQLLVDFRIADSERLARRENDQWTVSQVTCGACLRRALLFKIADCIGHKGFRLELKPLQCGCLLVSESDGE
jgi:hypothetical protein